MTVTKLTVFHKAYYARIHFVVVFVVVEVVPIVVVVNAGLLVVEDFNGFIV